MFHYAKGLSAQPGFGHVKWILPHAHLMPVTGNGGAVMNSWFDCYSFDIANRREDEVGLYRVVEQINDIISTEENASKIPSHRIIVGGLSQGSAVSILTALTTQRPLAGVFILSGYVPLRKKTKEIASPLAPTLSIFWGHGCLDLQVRYDFALECAQTLASDLGIPFRETEENLDPTDFSEPGSRLGLRFMTYKMLPHWMCGPEMEDLGVWMEALIPRNSAEGMLTSQDAVHRRM